MYYFTSMLCLSICFLLSVAALGDSPTERGVRATEDKVYVVTSILSEPFVILKPDAEKFTGIDAYDGYCIDLLKMIQQIYPFKFKFHIVADKRYGKTSANGSWDGMIGELLREEADLAIASLVITKQRERVVTFSKPFMTSGIGILVKKKEPREISTNFLSPFSTEIWLLVCVGYLIISGMIFVLNNLISKPQDWMSLSDSLWLALMGAVQQGADKTPRSISARVATAIWWSFMLVFVCTYIANLTVLLSGPIVAESGEIRSAEDLVKQPNLKYGIQAGGATELFFRDSTIELYQRMYQFMKSDPNNLARSYADGIKRVRDSDGKYAFLLEQTAAEYVSSKKPCDTTTAGGLLNSISYGIATRFGSELAAKINLAILELNERGSLKKLHSKWWKDRSECSTGDTSSISPRRSMQNMGMLLFAVVVGLLICLAIGAVEFLLACRRISKTEQIPFTKAITSQCRGLVGCKKPVDLKHRQPYDEDGLAIEKEKIEPEGI